VPPCRLPGAVYRTLAQHRRPAHRRPTLLTRREPGSRRPSRASCHALSGWPVSNRRPPGPKPGALPTALRPVTRVRYSYFPGYALGLAAPPGRPSSANPWFTPGTAKMMRVSLLRARRGETGIRTPGLPVAGRTLYQLSYFPMTPMCRRRHGACHRARPGRAAGRVCPGYPPGPGQPEATGTMFR
jgi:hypothetical protein